VPTAGITIRGSRGETILRVTAYGTASAGAVQVDSCNICGAIPPAMWERATRDAINRRSSSGGHDKGRVLFARHLEFPSRQLTPLAAATVHFSGSGIRILHLGYARGLVEPQRSLAAQRMLQCLRAVAREHGVDQLEWLQHTREKARECCHKYGFSLVRRSRHRYAGLRSNDWLVQLTL
jgi:hypothetical protein